MTQSYHCSVHGTISTPNCPHCRQETILLDVLRRQQAAGGASAGEQGSSSFQETFGENADYELLRSSIVMLIQTIKSIEDERTKEMLYVKAHLSQLQMRIDDISQHLGLDED